MFVDASRRRPLRVGVQLPEVERVVRWPELVAIGRRAEEVGFDSLWVGDHLLYRFRNGEARGPWECWSVLAALAAVTSRVALGPLVACTAFHAPAVLAKERVVRGHRQPAGGGRPAHRARRCDLPGGRARPAGGRADGRRPRPVAGRHRTGPGC